MSSSPLEDSSGTFSSSDLICSTLRPQRRPTAAPGAGRSALKGAPQAPMNPTGVTATARASGSKRMSKTFCAAALAAAALVSLATTAAASDEAPGSAMARLREGNATFVANASQALPVTADQRLALTKGQHPFAIVLSCARFARGARGDLPHRSGRPLRRPRGGGGPRQVGARRPGSAAEHLNVRALVVMGHESCGAVKAAESIPSRARPRSGPNLDYLVKNIKPAFARMRSAADAEHLRDAILANVEQVVNDLLAKSEIITHLHATGKLGIAGAYYELESGRVRFSEPVPPAAAGTHAPSSAPHQQSRRGSVMRSLSSSLAWPSRASSSRPGRPPWPRGRTHPRPRRGTPPLQRRQRVLRLLLHRRQRPRPLENRQRRRMRQRRRPTTPQRVGRSRSPKPPAPSRKPRLRAHCRGARRRATGRGQRQERRWTPGLLRPCCSAGAGTPGPSRGRPGRGPDLVAQPDTRGCRAPPKAHAAADADHLAVPPGTVTLTWADEPAGIRKLAWDADMTPRGPGQGIRLVWKPEAP